MVKIPTFSRHTEPAQGGTPADTNRDGRVDERDERPTAGATGVARPVTDPATTDRTTTDRVAADRTSTDRPVTGGKIDDSTAAGPNAPTEAERRLATTDLTKDRTDPAPPVDSKRVESAPPRENVEPAAPVGPRARVSVMATISLILAVCGALMVLSGALAGYGIALGAIAVVLSFPAFAATRRRHVAGKLDAMLALAIGGFAVVLGVLAFSGAFGWPNTDGDWVVRLREWLDSQFIDRF